MTLAQLSRRWQWEEATGILVDKIHRGNPTWATSTVGFCRGRPIGKGPANAARPEVETQRIASQRIGSIKAIQEFYNRPAPVQANQVIVMPEVTKFSPEAWATKQNEGIQAATRRCEEHYRKALVKRRRVTKAQLAALLQQPKGLLDDCPASDISAIDKSKEIPRE